MISEFDDNFLKFIFFLCVLDSPPSPTKSKGTFHELGQWSVLDPFRNALIAKFYAVFVTSEKFKIHLL